MLVELSKIKENPTFLRYHAIWRANPSSVVFAPLAEILMTHKCYQEAITVCKKGLVENPDLVSGRIALARAYVGVSNYKRADEEARFALSLYPGHPEALEIITVSQRYLGGVVERIERAAREEVSDDVELEISESKLNEKDGQHWNTVTMAEIFAAQGDLDRAREIYNDVLKRNPEDMRASEGLSKLGV